MVRDFWIRVVKIAQRAGEGKQPDDFHKELFEKK